MQAAGSRHRTQSLLHSIRQPRHATGIKGGKRLATKCDRASREREITQDGGADVIYVLNGQVPSAKKGSAMSCGDCLGEARIILRIH